MVLSVCAAAGNAAPRVLAYIASMQFVDGLALYRIESIFARMSVDLPRSDDGELDDPPGRAK
jgi:transposase